MRLPDKRCGRYLRTDDRFIKPSIKELLKELQEPVLRSTTGAHGVLRQAPSGVPALKGHGGPHAVAGQGCHPSFVGAMRGKRRVGGGGVGATTEGQSRQRGSGKAPGPAWQQEIMCCTQKAARRTHVAGGTGAMVHKDLSWGTVRHPKLRPSSNPWTCNRPPTAACMKRAPMLPRGPKAVLLREGGGCSFAGRRGMSVPRRTLAKGEGGMGGLQSSSRHQPPAWAGGSGRGGGGRKFVSILGAFLNFPFHSEHFEYIYTKG